jgi:hypothetical protein
VGEFSGVQINGIRMQVETGVGVVMKIKKENLDILELLSNGAMSIRIVLFEFFLRV